MSSIRYCWLDLTTGVFSNSWDEQTHNNYVDQVLIDMVLEESSQFKLIKYECLNDDDLNFIN